MPSEEEFCKIAKQELSYTAWGRLRNPATQVPYTAGSEPALFLGRGYTGHEHLPWFGLINMNARLYDPALGRFLSPDPYVQMPDFTQNFNRYSYCLNNPLVYVDEDGESFILVAAIIGAWMGMGQAMISSDKTGWGLVGDMFKGALVGGAAGALGAWAGGVVSGALNFGGFFGGAISGGAGGGLGGFVGGAGNAWLLQGANFGQGIQAGLIGGGIGLASGALLGGITRGISDYKNGYDFWNGSKIQTFGFGNQNTKDIISNYDVSNSAKSNDLYLKNRMDEMFGISEGDLGIKKITTMGNDLYGVNSDGFYVDNKTNELVGGFADLRSNGKSFLHVSPHYSLTPDNVMFRVVAGHELVHVYHNYTLLHVNSVFTERVAYKYSSDVLIANGRIADYMNAMTIGSSYFKNIGFFPPQYKIPSNIFKLW